MTALINLIIFITLMLIYQYILRIIIFHLLNPILIGISHYTFKLILFLNFKI